MKSALTIADLRDQSRKRLPKILSDWIDGGAGDELGLRRNEEIFRGYTFLPRYLRDVSLRNQRKALFGTTYDSPFGIAPTGYAGLFRPGADLMLAQSAQDANIPFILSGASVDPIEDVMKVAPDHTWYQLYGATDFGITADLIRRTADANCRVLVITIDIPVAAKRERDLRNGFSIPLKITAKLILDGLTHPKWTSRYLLSGGTPRMAGWAPYAPQAKTASQLAEFANSHSYCVQTWDHLEKFRHLWPGQLVVKGVMHPDDARRAVAMGADGLIISNHGGRQYDRAPTAIEILPSILDAVASAVPVMMDGGIRRGSDVLTSLACGASYVFAGRAMLYGLVAGGLPGAGRAIAILREELDQLMGQIGCMDMADITPDLIFKA